MTMPGLRILLAASFVLAALSVTPWITGDPATLFFLAAPAWLVLAVIILLRYRLRGLWVLFGLPFALAVWYALLMAACSRGQGCL